VNLVLLVTTLLTAAHAQASADVLKPCTVPGLARPARCGTITVPETRGASDGRSISLRTVVVPAAPRLHDDPIVFVAGGPGQGAAGLASFILQLLQGLDEGRDVVLVDQRGTGRSNPLTCAGGFDLLSASRRKELVACAEALRRRANLNAYGTDDAVQDLEQARVALGYERIHLVAASYGTRPALEYMRRYPARVNTAILRAVAPPGFNIVAEGSINAEAALRRVLDDCRLDPACAVAAGDVHAHLQAVREKAAASPTGVAVTLPNSTAVVLTDSLVAQVLYALLLTADTRQQLPLLLKRAATDGLAIFAPLASTIAEQIYGGVSFGMYLSVVCREDAPRTTERQRRQMLSVADSGAMLLEACAVWPVTPQPAPPPLTSDVPTILLSGVVDPATPASTGDEAARHLSRARHVVLPATAHTPMFPACGIGSLREFLTTRAPEGVNLSCAGDAKLKPFVPRL
jgi:pimeloyl-ACP methyl ester carboxylesterase